MALGLNADLVYDSPQIRVNDGPTKLWCTPGLHNGHCRPQDGTPPLSMVTL